MSWRAGLFLLIGIPTLLALGDAIVGGMSFGVLSYPFAMLSIWQHGRSISRHAFVAATAEASTSEATSQQQRLGIARALDGAPPTTQATPDVCYISQAAYDAGLQAKRRRPTIIEGFALTAAALMIVSIGLSIALPVFGAAKRRTAATQKQTSADSFPSQAAPEPSRQPLTQSKREPEQQAPILRPLTTPSASQIIRGHDLAYSITLPPNWRFERRSDDYDVLASFKSLYVGVIAEEAQLGTPETIANIARQKLKESATELKWSEPAPLMLDGRRWMQFVVTAHVETIPAAFQFYVYSGPEGTFQVIGYTSQNLFTRDAPLMRDVMKSFRFPK